MSALHFPLLVTQALLGLLNLAKGRKKTAGAACLFLLLSITAAPCTCPEILSALDVLLIHPNYLEPVLALIQVLCDAF